MDNRDFDMIERQLEIDRAALKASMSALGDRLMPEGLGGELLAHAQGLGRLARANPVLASVAGAGLAWYVLRRKAGAAEADFRRGASVEAQSRWEDEGGQPAEDDGLDWVSEAESLRAQANASLHKLEALALDGLEYAKQRGALLADLARDVRTAMRRGLDQVSTAAQDRILAAREAAYEAQLSLRASSAKAMNDHPVAVTGAALALGVAVSAAMMRRPAHDRKLAHEHDRLLAETRRLLIFERRRATEAMDILAGSRTLRDSS